MRPRVHLLPTDIPIRNITITTITMFMTSIVGIPTVLSR
jgi:hypothetical protein